MFHLCPVRSDSCVSGRVERVGRFTVAGSSAGRACGLKACLGRVGEVVEVYLAVVWSRSHCGRRSAHEREQVVEQVARTGAESSGMGLQELLDDVVLSHEQGVGEKTGCLRVVPKRARLD
jgi:hypothetical protein